MKDYKKDFPIFQNNSHLVYLDSAATSQKPQSVIDAITTFYTTYNANIRRGLYPLAEQATEAIEKARVLVRDFIHAKHSEEVIFVRNATEAINLVAYTFSENISQKNAIATTIMEHHSNFVPWQYITAQKNAEMKVFDIDEEGVLAIDYDELQNVKLFALTHVSNVLGTINPIKEIISRARKINPDIKILIDAAQSVSHIPVDVQDLDCDFLVFSGHKMMAATGIGVLYGKKDLLELLPLFLYGGDMIQEVSVTGTTFASSPQKFEAGTPDIAGIISLGAAIEYLNSTGIENIRVHELNMLHECIQQMEKVQGITIYGPKDRQQRSSVTAFTINGIHPHDVAQVLAEDNICIRAGHHCAMPLHNRLGIPASARISFSLYNDEQDISRFISGIKKVKSIFTSNG